MLAVIAEIRSVRTPSRACALAIFSCSRFSRSSTRCLREPTSPAAGAARTRCRKMPKKRRRAMGRGSSSGRTYLPQVAQPRGFRCFWLGFDAQRNRLVRRQRVGNLDHGRLVPPLRGLETLHGAQGLGRAAPQRADLLTVVLVRDLAGPVVELELLQRREGSVALLGELESPTLRL